MPRPYPHRVEPHADQHAGEQEAGPGKQRERRAARRRPEVGLDRIGQPVEPRRRRIGGVSIASCDGATRSAQTWPARALRPTLPQPGGQQHRHAHDVEDVHLEKRAQAATADDQRLQAEQKREAEDLPGPSRARRPSPPTSFMPRRIRALAASTIATPARNRKIGAPNPPRTIAHRYDGRLRSATRVQESSVCASIMISTPTPRSQSR